MKRFLFTAFFISFIWLNQSSAQGFVWPGDVNNNGAVSAVDLLYWGLAFDTNGPPRAEEETEWAAYPIEELWTQNFPDGINYAYADCNGDGFIDEEDFDKAIEDNFGLEHSTPLSDGYQNSSSPSAPKLRLIPSANQVDPGDTVDIHLMLDDSSMPINNFYGIALKMSYNPEVLEGDNGPDFDMIEDNWIEGDNSYVQELFFENNQTGKAALGITRTNQTSVPVDTGFIGSFSIVIEDIIIGIYQDTFRLQIDSIRLMTHDFNTIAVAPDTVDVIISGKKKDSLTPFLYDTYMQANSHFLENRGPIVFPNPTTGRFNLISSHQLQEAILTDNFGKKIQITKRQLGDGLYEFNCPELPEGIYFLQVIGIQERFTKKIIIVN